MKKKFGYFLRELRTKNGLSIKQLSSQVDVNYSYISKLENNHTTPSEDFIFKVAALFNYDPEELMLRAGKVPPDLLEILINNPTKAAEFLRNEFSKHGFDTKKKIH